MVSDRRVVMPVSPVSEASADLPGSWSRGCRLSASVLHCPLVVLSGKGTSLFPDWALSSPERAQGPWAIGGEGRRGPRGPISDTVEPKIPSSPGTITTCSLMLELSQWSLTTLPQGFTFLDASCNLSQTLAGRCTQGRGDTPVASGAGRDEFDPGDHCTCGRSHAEFCTRRSYKASPGTARCRL